jgi:hypothetical protein
VEAFDQFEIGVPHPDVEALAGQGDRSLAVEEPGSPGDLFPSGRHVVNIDNNKSRKCG